MSCHGILDFNAQGCIEIFISAFFIILRDIPLCFIAIMPRKKACQRYRVSIETSPPPGTFPPPCKALSPHRSFLFISSGPPYLYICPTVTARAGGSGFKWNSVECRKNNQTHAHVPQTGSPRPLEGAATQKVSPHLHTLACSDVL